MTMMRIAQTLQLFRGQTITTNENSWELDVGWAQEGLIWLKITNASGTLDAKVQISANRSDWADEGTEFPQISANGWYFVKVSNIGSFIRLAFTVSGSFGVTAFFVGKT